MNYFSFISLASSMLIPTLMAADLAPEISRSFNKDECAVTYQTSEKKMTSKIVKKEALEKLGIRVDPGYAPVACTKEVLKKFEVSSEECKIFCNPNK